MPRGKPKSYSENVKELEERQEYIQRRLSEKPLLSPCLAGRLRHRFRSPKTRTLTSDLKCWYCGKTVAEVRKEREQKKRAFTGKARSRVKIP